MWTLKPDLVMRPEAKGALLFNPENAETVYLDRNGLSFLRALVKGENHRERVSVSLLLHLRRGGILIQGKKGSKRCINNIDICLDARIEEIPHSLSAPETLHIALTDSCDQFCQGCFYSKGANRSELFLSNALFDKILSSAQRAKVLQFAFGGGEPLCHPDLPGFVKKSSAKNIVPNITTNGNLLTEDLGSELRNSGLGQLQISLNASTPETNARTRPNYNQAVKAMETCKKVGLRFGINTLVTQENFRQLPSLFAFAERTGAQGVNLLRPKPPVNSSGWLEDVSLSPSQNKELHHLLIQEGKKKKISITLDQSLSFLAYHRNSVELYYNGVWGCGAGRRFLTIDPQGTVYPCSHFREPIGSDGNFAESWKSSRLLESFRTLEESIKEPCLHCNMISVCRGCRAVVTELGGDFLSGDPHCPLFHIN